MLKDIVAIFFPPDGQEDITVKIQRLKALDLPEDVLADLIRKVVDEHHRERENLARHRKIGMLIVVVAMLFLFALLYWIGTQSFDAIGLDTIILVALFIPVLYFMAPRLIESMTQIWLRRIDAREKRHEAELTVSENTRRTMELGSETARLLARLNKDGKVEESLDPAKDIRLIESKPSEPPER